MKRKPPIAKGLVRNSISAMFGAIEVHNKPSFPYRYEVVVLLTINAWELLLKAYIYKNLKKVKLFKQDGSSKPFLECVACVSSNLGKACQSLHENLEKLYEFRNTVAHFHSDSLDILIFALVKKSIEFYKDFLQAHFKTDIAKESDLVLLPIGFRRMYSPLDFLSDASAIKDAPSYVKTFVKSVIDSTERLKKEGIDEPILVDFRMTLINEKRIKNADIIAGINNARDTGVSFNVVSDRHHVSISNNPSAPLVRLTREKEGTDGIILHEELSDGIFDEINNVLDANRLLSPGGKGFVLGENVYYRIYAERQHVQINDGNLEVLGRATFYNLYGPNLSMRDVKPKIKYSQFFGK